MAREFATISTNLVNSTVSTFPVTDFPVTMSAWGLSHDQSSIQILIHLTDASLSADQYFSMGTVTSSSLLEFDTTLNTSVITAGYSTNVWNHFASTFASDSLRELFLNGVSKGTNTQTTPFPTGLDEINIGRRGGSSPDRFWDGEIAEVGLWDVVLTDDEIVALSNGVSCNQIRPNNLVGYWPIWNDSLGTDLSGNGNNLTDNSTIASSNHPPIGRTIKPPTPTQRRVRSLDDAVVFDKVVPV